MTMRSKVEFVLDYLEKFNGNIRTRVVVNGSCIKVKNLAIHHFLGTANVAYAVKKLTPVSTAPIAFQPFVIHREALYYILFQPFRRPSSEMSGDNRPNPISQRNNHIKIIEWNLTGNLPSAFLPNL